MSDLIKVALRALKKAEVEMRYAGWSVYRDDNFGQFDAMKQVLDAIHFLRNCEGQMKDEALPSDKFKDCVATPNQAMNMANVGKQQYPAEQSGQLTGGFGWYKSGESNDYDPKGLHITQTPVPQTATDCTLRTALAQPEDVMVRFSRINQEMDGLLHDRAHTDTGKTRAAQSVRTPEMSYRPGSLPMEDKPVGWIYKFGKTTFLAKLPLTDEYIAGGWTAEPVYTRPQPLRELTEDEIDKAWRSSTIDYTAPYDQFRIDVARAIIDAAKEVK